MLNVENKLGINAKDVLQYCVYVNCEAEEKNQFSFVCIFLVFNRNWRFFSNTLGLRKVDL